MRQNADFVSRLYGNVDAVVAVLHPTGRNREPAHRTGDLSRLDEGEDQREHDTQPHRPQHRAPQRVERRQLRFPGAQRDESAAHVAAGRTDRSGQTDQMLIPQRRGERHALAAGVRGQRFNLH